MFYATAATVPPSDPGQHHPTLWVSVPCLLDKNGNVPSYKTVVALQNTWQNIENVVHYMLSIVTSDM